MFLVAVLKAFDIQSVLAYYIDSVLSCHAEVRSTKLSTSLPKHLTQLVEEFSSSEGVLQEILRRRRLRMTSSTENSIELLK